MAGSLIYFSFLLPTRAALLSFSKPFLIHFLYKEGRRRRGARLNHLYTQRRKPTPPSITAAHTHAITIVPRMARRIVLIGQLERRGKAEEKRNGAQDRPIAGRNNHSTYAPMHVSVAAQCAQLCTGRCDNADGTDAATSFGRSNYTFSMDFAYLCISFSVSTPCEMETKREGRERGKR